MDLSSAVQPLISPVCMALFVKITTFFTRNDVDEAILEDLKTQFLCLNAVLGDAEVKQMVNPYVRKWVDKLREALYDADDVLDQLATKALLESNKVLSKVTDYIYCIKEPFDKGMKSKLNKINDRLKSLANHRYLLGLKEGGGKTSFLSMPTTCLINELEVYGRHGERDDVIDTLLSVPTTCILNVIAIVGMAGMGKTTLSQMVYNHPRVKSHFKVRSWIYVSDGSNVFEVTKKIYESLTFSNCKIRDLNTLQMKLEILLQMKRFLLVLDDYWAEDFLDWNLLKRPLESGDHGSCIIVTTRNKSVALTVHAAEIFMLPSLSNEACWQLFSHHAFRNKDPQETPALKEIGEQIVRKCNGHPLSVKTLGSLLTFKAEVKEWNSVLQSKVWDLPAHKSNILPALMLSYRYLPGHLKQCFSYCSMFPKGYRDTKRNLIYLWMAEGLLPELKNEETMEEVGEEYFNELSSRSFLQSSNSSFNMHDLMIDLAQHVGGEFFHKMEPNDPQQFRKKVRHLSFLSDEFNGIDKFVSIFDLSHLRTFLPLSDSRLSRSIEGFLKLLLSQARRLRVLSLSNYPITKLPKSIQNLEHLRYLNLSHTSIKELTNYVKYLYNLQTLLLSQCKDLTNLPKDLKELTSLQHLDISGTDKLEKMPPGFGELKRLQLLTTFVVSKRGSKISELGALSKLHGALSTVNLQEVVDDKDASDANLKEKKFLDELELKWTDGIHGLWAEQRVLHNLQPHTNLKTLKIEHYGGIEFPPWLGSSSFSNMISVHLVSCKNCLSLPPLGELPYLKMLHIANMESVELVNSTFFGDHDRPFNSLESLTFMNMSKWQQWELGAGREFPSLQVFSIKECPVLVGSLPKVPALQNLELSGCSALAGLPEDFMPVNASRSIHGCPLLVQN